MTIRFASLGLETDSMFGVDAVVDCSNQAADVLTVLGDVGEAEREAAYELGGTLAALLSR